MKKSTFGIVILSIFITGLFAFPWLIKAQQGGTTSFIYDDNGRLHAVIAPNGDAAIYVYDAAGNRLAIVRSDSTIVTISNFTPTNGPVGTTVAINGTGFGPNTGDNTVRFNGATAEIVSATATQLIATVPTRATSGLITVVSPLGAAISSTPFSIPPVVDDFTPLIGTPGTQVSINGSNFETTASSNQVSFNVGSTHATTSSTKFLTATVPSTATSGHITVATGFGQDTSTDDFFVPPAPYTAADVDYTGRVAIGGSLTVSLHGPGKIGLVVFDGMAGQQIDMVIPAFPPFDAQVTLYAPDGTLLSGPNPASGLVVDSQSLPVTGTYTLLFVANQTAPLTGTSATFQLFAASNISGTITAGGPPVTVNSTITGENTNLTFNGTAGQRVSVRVSDVTFASGSVSLHQPNGALLGSVVPLVAGSIGFIDLQTLPTNGIYTIEIHPGAPGSATVTLFTVPADISGTITIGGPSVQVSTTVPAQNAQLTFDAVAGQQVIVLASEVTMANSRVTLKGPNGDPLFNFSVNAGNQNFGGQVLQSPGTYTISIDPIDDSVGNLTTSLFLLPSPYVFADVQFAERFGIPSQGRVQIDTPNKIAVIAFDATAGQKVSIASNALPGIPLTIYGPDGTVFSPTHDAGFTDAISIPTTGVYVAIISGGNFTVSINLSLFDASDVVGTIAPDGQPVTLTTNVPGQNIRLSFNGTIGQRISLAVSTQLTGLTLISHVSIYDTDGTTPLVQPIEVQQAIGGFINTTTLPHDGVYSILIDPTGLDTGSVTSTLYNVPADATGTIAIGGPSLTLSTTVPGQNANATFTGTAGQPVTLRWTNSTYTGVRLSIKDANDNELFSVGTASPSGIGNQITLPANGNYSVKVDPIGANIGSIDLTLLGASTNPGGTIAPDGSPTTLTFTLPNQTGQFTFTGHANQKVSFTVDNPDNRLEFIGWNVRLTGPDGSLIAESNIDSDHVNPFVPEFLLLDTQLLPTDGTYTITIATHDSNSGNDSTGTWTFHLYNVVDVTGPVVVNGPTVPVALNTPGQSARFTFNGVANEKLILKMDNQTFRNILFDMKIRIGLASDMNLGLPGDIFPLSSSTSSDVLFLTLPATDTYVVEFHPNNGDTGSFNFSLFDTPPDVTGTVTIDGPAVNATASQPFQNISLTFNGAAGQQVLLTFTAPSSVGASISGPIIGHSIGFSSVGSTTKLTLPDPGTYTIFITENPINYSFAGTATIGNVTVQLSSSPADATATITPDGSPHILQAALPFQNAAFKFSGTANQRVAAAVEPIDGGFTNGGNIFLIHPNGTTLAGPIAFGQFGQIIDTLTLPDPGIYTIQVVKSNGNPGRVKLTLYDVPPDPTAVLTVGGPTQTVTTTANGQSGLFTFTGTSGQSITAHITNNVAAGTVYVLAPDGSTVLSTTVPFHNPSTPPFTLSNVMLTQDGTYTIRVYPSITLTGSISVALTSP